MQGEWFHRSTVAAKFAAHNMFAPQELAPILPYLPDGEIHPRELDKYKVMDSMVPREVTRSVLEKLQAFHRATAELYRGNVERLDRAHSLLAHSHKVKMMTLQEIALEVLQKRHTSQLTDVMLWTVHSVLERNPGFRQIAGHHHRLLPMWRVSPLKQLQDYEQVRAWIRDYLEGVVTQATTFNDLSSADWIQESLKDSNPIPGFIKKAQRLIRTSRSHRKVSAPSVIGPSFRQVGPIESHNEAIVKFSTVTTWNPMEQAVIKFLHSFAITRDIPKLGSAFSLAPMLLRAVNMYEGYELDEQTATLLLKEMGVVAPWEDRAIFNSMLRLPVSHDPTARLLQESALESVAAIEQQTGGLEDSMAGLRKDWGNMPVYCIDSASAQEIDDGVSLERVQGDDSTFWVHIHIANPSAFIKPDNAIARYAAILLESIYLLDKSYTMLSPRLTQRHFSLARDRPVLTMSAKLTSNGDMLATEITPGWIRNVKRLTPDQVDRELGSTGNSSSKTSRVLRVGHLVEADSCARTQDPLSSSDILSSSEISDLRKLEELGQARHRKRSSSPYAAGEFVRTMGDWVPDPQVYIQKDGLGPTFLASYGRQVMGDPAISWEARDINLFGEGIPGNTLVKELMIIAGEAAAQWCSARNIPGIYRAQCRTCRGQ